MKKLLLLLVLIAEISTAYSQDYDLIVKTNGDSIACSIDSVSNMLIYFEMKYNNNWIHTQLSRNEVAEYKYNAIEWRNHVFKVGTSYIQPGIRPVRAFRDIHKNCVYVGVNIIALPVIYERVIPVGKKAGILAGAGIIQEWLGEDITTNPTVKVGIIAGNGKHLFEGGTYLPFLDKNGNLGYFLPYLGYRYQSFQGFFIRADIAVLMPGISIGYSF